MNTFLQSVYEEPCVLVTKQIAPDGYGGQQTVWTDSGEFKAVVIDPQSTQKEIAKQLGVTSVYSVGTHRDVVLNVNDVFRRVRDGQTFRVTTDGIDNFTPKSSAIDMRYVQAEKWVIPNG